MEKELERQIARVNAEYQRQYDALHPNPTNQFMETSDGMSFNIGLTREEMCKKLKEDPSRFRAIYLIAAKGVPSWEEAETIYTKQIIRKENLLDNVSRSYQSRYPNEPKPRKLFQEFHKRRKKPTKTQLVKRATNYLNWKKAADAINTEEATPLDEENIDK